MFTDTITNAAQMSVKKVAFLRENFFGYIVASSLSGIYIGLGIVLIFSLGAPFAAIASPAVKLVMGACFGIALTLVLFAGCELFTSNAMFMTFGLARKQVSWLEACKIWFFSWVGGLVGSLLLAWIVVIGNSVPHSYALFAKVASVKMHAPIIELIARAVLCNMLVCLAVWISLRTTSDTAKIMVIFWCLFGFIGAGYEHSVANMSLLAIAIFANPELAELSWQGYGYNLLWVTIGNWIGGAIFIAGSYILASRQSVTTVKNVELQTE